MGEAVRAAWLGHGVEVLGDGSSLAFFRPKGRSSKPADLGVRSSGTMRALEAIVRVGTRRTQVAISISATESVRSVGRPLSVQRPPAASASLWVYGPSLSALTLGQYVSSWISKDRVRSAEYIPPLVRFSAPMRDQSRFALVVFGALDAIVTTQSR